MRSALLGPRVARNAIELVHQRERIGVVRRVARPQVLDRLRQRHPRLLERREIALFPRQQETALPRLGIGDERPQVRQHPQSVRHLPDLRGGSPQLVLACFCDDEERRAQEQRQRDRQCVATIDGERAHDSCVPLPARQQVAGSLDAGPQRGPLSRRDPADCEPDGSRCAAPDG
jgi:hypothetical protein